MAASLAQVLRGAPVAVGTENPAKLRAVRDALDALASEGELLVVRGWGVASGVADQPVGWAEIAAGARNRALGALRAAGSAALGIGIEDGLVELPCGTGGGLAVVNVGCAWVSDGERDGTGYSAGFAYPPPVSIQAFRDRQPIGDLFDAFWSQHRPPVPVKASALALSESGRQGGNIGQLTQGRLDRSAYGAQAVLCALVPFLHADLYD